MSNKWIIIILLALSIATHFAYFGHPSETVFDEVHFGKFISAYYTGEYYFDIHPPLGKLVIAGFAKIVSAKGGPASGGELEYNFTEIGKEFPDKKYLALRLLPAIAGTLLPIIIYLLALELGLSRMAAFTGALLVVFDNALLTQSRLILMDPFLLLFGFISLLFYFRYHNQLYPRHSHILKNMRMSWDWNQNLFLMAVFGGFAISIKWTGLGFIALPIVVETAKILKTRRTDIKQAIAYFMSVLKVASFFLISFVIYFSIFAIHFSLLPKPGPGDAFMKPNFRENNVVKNIRDLNIEMYKSNQRLTATHPYSSQWYTWPLMTRPIYYWTSPCRDCLSVEPISQKTSRIYFFGNPIIWWSSTAAVLLLTITLLRNFQFSILPTPPKLPLRLRRPGNFQSSNNFQLKTGYILLGGYILNLLPFVGINRVMFLYHYLAALIFAILMLVYLIDKTKNAKKNFSVLIIASVVAFIFFAPLSYGLPLSQNAYNARVWFASWR